MNRNGCTWLLAVILVSCGGSTPAPSGASTRETKGTQCLADAAAAPTVPPTAPARIEVRHILVRHSRSSDPKGATRSKEAACLQALSALEALQSGAMDWEQAVARYSDAKEDDLGRVSADELNPAFAGSAFSLDVDQLSYVVETDRGYHVIWRER